MKSQSSPQDTQEMNIRLELDLAGEQQVKQVQAVKQDQGETEEAIDNKTSSQAAAQTIVKIHLERTDLIAKADKEISKTKTLEEVAKTMAILKTTKKT